jgi:hypothetical protein
MRRDVMQSVTLTICVCVTLFLSVASCSKEEEAPPPLKGNKVVKPIKKPSPPQPKKAKTEQARIVTLKKTRPDEKKKAKAEMAAVSAKGSEKPDMGEVSKEGPQQREPGYYYIRKGDSLARIAGRKDVYGDPLKWPILCRFNMDKLGKMAVGEDFADRPLLEGMKLKIITPEEKKRNLEKQANKMWIVNVLSTPNTKEIIPATMKLLKEGYLAYITRTKVKGKDYMRLRVGFFGTKTQADAAGKKIKALLNLGDPWKTKAGKEEFKEFAGY